MPAASLRHLNSFLWQHARIGGGGGGRTYTLWACIEASIRVGGVVI
jgi:hypothetical protein